MELAKDALDVGLLTDDEAMIAFFESEVGLGPPERLEVAPGVTQHRFAAQGSVLKVNVVSELPIQARSGYAAVILADERLGPARTLAGPDGVIVEIARPGAMGGARLVVRLRVPDAEAARRYFRDALEWEVAGDTVRVGTSAVLLEESADAPAAVELPVRGWTYLTVQIFDCDAVTARAVDRGARLAAGARNLGEIARYSMVADPFGNQLEISQRASVTGVPIGPDDGPAGSGT